VYVWFKCGAEKKEESDIVNYYLVIVKVRGLIICLYLQVVH
jgi:hypothetical protein